MTDVWEIANGLDPNTFDGDVDSDGDLWFNIEEYSNNTNPHSSDNGPSVTGQLDTSSSDWDGDGASNYTELYLEHSDPRTAAPNDDWDGDGYLNEDEIAAGTDPHDANSHPNSGQTGYWQTVVLTVFEGNYQYGQETYELMQPSGLIVTYTTETSNTPMTYHFGIEAAGRSAAVLKADIEGATGNKVAEIISAEQQETWVGVTNPPAQQWSEGDNPDSMDDPHALEKLHASSYNAQYSSWNYDGFEVVKNEKVLPGTYRIDSPGRWSKQGYIMYYTIKVKMKKWQMQ